MEQNVILISAAIVVLSILLTYFIVSKKLNRKIDNYKTLAEAISAAKEELSVLGSKSEKAKKELSALSSESSNVKENLLVIESEYEKELEKLSTLDNETKGLQELKENEGLMCANIEKFALQLSDIKNDLSSRNELLSSKEVELHDLMSKVDLYTRVSDFVDNGHFEMPEYLYETSARFSEEIKRIRIEQKELIKSKNAVLYPSSTIISDDNSYNKKILDGQVKLMLSAFNIECDLLIGKVSPSSFSRTLERIEKFANNIEKSASTLRCGFNIRYIELKYEECKLQYQFTLKKQQEQDEQRLIKEQIREDQRAIKEYERAVAEAEKEERMYRDMLQKAREELSKVSQEDRVIAEQRIADLERQLQEAEAKEERAKSMAEQTRKGHVYVISNVGSFGEDVYKIGLTRRLEPMDRVKELGDASVPFSFDVHAMIYVDDAPSLESALHREFTASRVNAVNFRKEFFRTDLKSIKDAVDRLSGVDAEFKMTALAEDYYETRRLQGVVSSAA